MSVKYQQGTKQFSIRLNPKEEALLKSLVQARNQNNNQAMVDGLLRLADATVEQLRRDIASGSLASDYLNEQIESIIKAAKAVWAERAGAEQEEE